MDEGFPTGITEQKDPLSKFTFKPGSEKTEMLPDR